MDRIYIGIDAHSTQITTHTIVLKPDGTIKRSIARYSIEDLESAFLSTLDSNVHACVEAGSGSSLLARLIVATGAHAYLVHPNHILSIYQTGKKTDNVDAKKLADILMRHKEINDVNDGFPEVFIPDDQSQRLRMLINYYHHLVKSMNGIRNQMYGIFRQWLVPVKRGNMIDNLPSYKCHPRMQTEALMIIDQLLSQYRLLEEQKAQSHEAICKLGVERYPKQINNLIGINGISIFGASIIMADIIDIKRFKSAKKLTSYLHSAPRVDASNDKVKIGHINKNGRKASFGILLQSANHLLHSFPALERYYYKVVGKPVNKIRAAIVGKTIVRIFYILKNGEPSRFLAELNYQKKHRELKRYETMQNAA
jgi:transposase